MVDHRQEPRRWTIPDAARPAGTITIAGWDFGGSGPLALLSHANGLCAALWQLAARRLTRSFHVVAVDARGHGDSDAPPVPEGYAVWDYFVADLAAVARALLEETGERRIAIGAGNSFGGIITAATAAQHPELFERVAMLDPPFHATSDLLGELHVELAAEPDSRRGDLVAQTLRRTAVWPSRDAARRAWRDKPMFATWRPAAFDAYLIHGFRDREDGQVELKCAPALEAHIFATTGTLDVARFAPRVAAPTLLVRAGRGFFPAPLFRAVAGLFPNCTYREIDAGHLLPVEAPELTAATLTDFGTVSAAG